MTSLLDSIPNLSGKVAVVTGGNAGLGFETARVLAANGAHVIITGRSAERLQSATEKLNTIVKQHHADGGEIKPVEWMLCDLSSLQNVEKFTDEFRAKGLKLHILVNNAGAVFSEPPLTADGIEANLAINHLAHFYLTLRLLDIIKSSTPSRIVIVASEAHRRGSFKSFKTTDWSDLWGKENPGYEAYGTSKLANILFAQALARKLKDVPGVYVNATHPGFSKTDGAAKLPKGFTAHLIRIFAHIMATPPILGATSQLYAACHADIERKSLRGEYIGPTAHGGFIGIWTKFWCWLGGIGKTEGGKVKTRAWALKHIPSQILLNSDRHPACLDESESERLWETSLEIIEKKRVWRFENLLKL
ncbi:hypothetical protein HK102_011402 [Quaeritorhiza haematococci]|nr:hypothetical protein HK102_011402 [Quaeritorhiza haematococci]